MTTPNENGSPEIGIKGIGPMEFVDDAKGEVTSVVYTLDEVDREREVILSTAFQGGVRVSLSEYGHDGILAQMKKTGAPVKPPAGKGVLTIEGKQVVFRGKYFMSTQRGREAYATAKEMGSEQEWSFSYLILETGPPSEEWRAKGARRVHTKIAPFEVSPVTIAGGVGTHTVGVKCEGCGEMAKDPCGCADKKAAEEAAALASKAAEDAAAAQKAEEDRRAEEARQAQDAAVKQAAVEEFERFQRTTRRMGV